MWTLKIGLFCAATVLFLCSNGSRAQMPNLDNVGDILQTLKDSGMMDQFEKDLKQMLFEQKPVEAKEDFEEGATGTDEPPVDVYEFIKAYVTEKKIKLNEKVMLYLMELPIKDDLHVHLARLTGVLDKIGDISKLNKKQVDGKVIEAVKRIKSLSVMKTSLDKLYTENSEVKQEEAVQPEPVKPVVQPKAEIKAEKTKNKEKKNRDDEITGALTTFLEMIKARPEQMIQVLSTAMSAYNLVSPQTLKTGEMYVKMMSQTEYFNTFMDTIINYTETLGDTEIGQKLVDLAPHLMQATSGPEIFEILLREFNLTQEGILALVKDPGTKDSAIAMFAGFLTSAVNHIQTFLKDDMKMTFVNTFLLSQGFPSINSRKIVSSATKLVDKLINIFTPWDYDVKQHEKGMLEFVKAFEDKYVKWSDYHEANAEDQLEVMTRFLKDNLVEPAGYIWLAHQAISASPKCGESIMCALNSRMVKKESKLKSAMTRGLSLLASWAWGMDGSSDYSKLYEAIWTDDCEKRYPQSDDRACEIFDWQSSLYIDHVEL